MGAEGAGSLAAVRVVLDTNTVLSALLFPHGDPDDQMFVDLAAAGHAEVLVSGDGAVLALLEAVVFAIETPAQFQKRFA